MDTNQRIEALEARVKALEAALVPLERMKNHLMVVNPSWREPMHAVTPATVAEREAATGV